MKTAEDFYTKLLIPQYEEFVRDNTSSRQALLTFILAVHLFEWVHKDKIPEDYFLINHKDKDLERDFKIARLISNGTKHFSNKPVTTHTQTGFSSDFDNGFARPLYIKYEGREYSVDDILKNLINYWSEKGYIV